MLTTNQILTLARAKLLEQTEEIINDDTLLVYANLTYQDLIKRTFTNNKILTATVTLTNGVGALPALFGTLYGSAQDSYTNTFEEVSIEDFDNRTLERMVTIESGILKVYPLETPSVIIKYYPTFATLTSVQNPEIDEYFQELIVYGILSRAFEDLQDEQLAVMYSNKYETEFTKKQAAQSNYEEGNQRGGQMFSYQRLI